MASLSYSGSVKKQKDTDNYIHSSGSDLIVTVNNTANVTASGLRAILTRAVSDIEANLSTGPTLTLNYSAAKKSGEDWYVSAKGSVAGDVTIVAVTANLPGVGAVRSFFNTRAHPVLVVTGQLAP